MTGRLDSLSQPLVRLLRELCVQLAEVDAVVLGMANRSTVLVAVDVPAVHTEPAVLHKGRFAYEHSVSEKTATIIHNHIRAFFEPRKEHVHHSTHTLWLDQNKETKTLFGTQAKNKEQAVRQLDGVHICAGGEKLIRVRKKNNKDACRHAWVRGRPNQQLLYLSTYCYFLVLCRDLAPLLPPNLSGLTRVDRCCTCTQDELLASSQSLHNLQ